MPSLGLAMIVKNSAGRLRDCIASVAGVVDQIVIADTGSIDGTPELGRALGAEVFDFPWQDDFAKARNAAMRALSTDWALAMDDDEELDLQARDKIPALLRSTTVGGYCVTQRNYIPVRFGEGGHAAWARPIVGVLPHGEQARAYSDFPSYRLFRCHPDIYYVGRVHELADASVLALGLELAPTDIVIHHFGHLNSADKLRAKDELYRKLGRLKIEDAPNDPQSWIEIGLQEYEQFKNYSAGIQCFKKALALNPRCSTVPYISLAKLYVEIQADERALELLSNVAMKGRAAGEKEHVCGDAFYNLGRLKEARSSYLRALRILSEDVRISSKLGLTEVRLGLKKTGLSRLTTALEAAPDVFEMHDRMIKACILMNMMSEAAEAAERLAAGLPSPSTILRAAAIRGQMQQWNEGHDIILQGLQLFPQNQELLQAKAELAKKTNLAAGPVESLRFDLPASLQSGVN